MLESRTPLSVALLTSLLACAAPDARAGKRFVGAVVAVADGDTLTVKRRGRKVKIRLHGVDAPEKDQPFGSKAHAFTRRFVAGKKVRVEVVTTDRYRRTVGRVFVRGRSLGRALVRAGLAWHYVKYSKSKRLAALQRAARRARRGLWKASTPVAPWRWRRRKRGAKRGFVLSPPGGPTSSCRRRADCVFLPAVCGRCAPCAPRWRPVGNRRDLQRIRRTQAKVRCRRPKCRPCANSRNWRGTEAVCVNRRCRAREPRRAAPAANLASAPFHGNLRRKVVHGRRCRHFNCKHCKAAFDSLDAALNAGYRPHSCAKSASRACRRDRDCVFAWRPCGLRSRPCRDRWRPVVNRAADRRHRHTWRAKVPHCATRPPCPPGRPGRWLGRRPACVHGQCIARW